MLSQQTCLMEFRPDVFCPTGLSGVKGEGMMELEPSAPLLEAFGEEEEEGDEEMVRILVTSACHMTPRRPAGVRVQ